MPRGLFAAGASAMSEVLENESSDGSHRTKGSRIHPPIANPEIELCPARSIVKSEVFLDG
jgi:hypothetical protein